MLNLEKKKELADRIGRLHDHFETRIKHVWKEKEVIWDKYKEQRNGSPRPWEIKPQDIMSPEDVGRYGSLLEEENQFTHEVNEVIRESLDILSKDVGATWKRISSGGVQGSLAETNSRNYVLDMDDKYSFRVNWYNYPEDDGHVKETFREGYSAQIVGSKEVVTRKGVGGFGRKTEKQEFPLIVLGVSQDDERVFKPSKELESEFDEAERQKFQEELLELGERLRRQLG